ncbi:hypothetical protein [Proteiniphilum sp.]|uniref:tetratricopeptide repeat protein n=1 Tax=Proteiniphilum sp. TaxID=1926877 RepID=UPI00332619C0
MQLSDLDNSFKRMKGISLFTMTLLLIVGCTKSKGSSDATLVDSLLDLSYECRLVPDLEKSLSYSLEALALAQSAGYRKGIAESCFFIAQALSDTGNYSTAVEYIVRGEKYVDGDAKLKSEFIRVKARIYSNLELYDKAKKEFLHGLSYVKRIKQQKQRQFLEALAYENLAHLYRITDRPDSSFYYIQKKIGILDTMDESFVYTILINTYTSIGKLHADKMRCDSADAYFVKAIALADKYNFRYRSWIYTCQGDMYLNTENPDSALHYYSMALENLGETGLKAEYPALYEKVANIYLSLNDTITARKYKNAREVIEKEFNDEKLKASNNILNILINREIKFKLTQRKVSRILVAVIALLWTIIMLIFFFIRHKRANYWQEKEKEKEKEMQQEQEMQVLKIKVNESFTEIVELAKTNDSTFMVRFQEVYPEFTQAMSAYKLQLSELHLLALIYLQFTSKEIADCTYRSIRTVQNRKYRLRKKLGIDTDVDIHVWLNKILQITLDEQLNNSRHTLNKQTLAKQSI